MLMGELMSKFKSSMVLSAIIDILFNNEKLHCPICNKKLSNWSYYTCCDTILCNNLCHQQLEASEGKEHGYKYSKL